MSASIYYRVVNPHEQHIDVGAPSAFVSAMTRAFGRYPWRLDASSLSKLEGMAATNTDGASTNPYQQMIYAIQREREDGMTCEIEVWPEY